MPSYAMISTELVDWVHWLAMGHVTILKSCKKTGAAGWNVAKGADAASIAVATEQIPLTVKSVRGFVRS